MNKISEVFEVMKSEKNDLRWNEPSPGNVVAFLQGEETLRAFKEGRASLVWDGPSDELVLKLDFRA